MLHFVIVLLVTTHFLAVGLTLPLPTSGLYAVWLVASLWSTGGLMEGREVFRFAEALRRRAHGVAAAQMGSWFGTPIGAAVQATIAATCLVSLIWEWRYL